MLFLREGTAWIPTFRTCLSEKQISKQRGVQIMLSQKLRSKLGGFDCFTGRVCYYDSALIRYASGLSIDHFEDTFRSSLANSLNLSLRGLLSDVIARL